MTKEKQKSVVSISFKSFIAAVLILLVLMILSYILTMVIPAGEFNRTVNSAGQEIIVDGTYHATEGEMTLGKFFLSPILVLTGSDSVTLIAIIIFLLVIGATFNALDHSGTLKYMLLKIVDRFKEKKQIVLYVVSFFFMFMGAAVGSFEEVVPLVPIVIALAYTLGWDVLTGMGMSILAVCCGFSSGVINPFTVGVAQQLADVPLFSGLGYRMVGFVVIYILLILFLKAHIKRIEASGTIEIPENFNYHEETFVKNKKMDRALLCFMIVMGVTIITILASSQIEFLSAILLPIVALMFFIAGTLTSAVSGMKAKEMFKSFGSGAVSILPAVLLILMAGSVKYIITQGKILDTILNSAYGLIENASPLVCIMLIYLLVLLIEFFIPSGSAKAVLLMPIIAPLADAALVSRQTAILAYAYGDGFSNILYPTNAVLLIVLGLAGISYGKWFKYVIKFELAVFVVTTILLFIANTFVYTV
ncbi:MAG: YfcC family protein [Anaerofustis sp.]